MVGRVIGKNGETVKALQAFSGAQIQIDQTTDPTRVSITGAPYSLSLAVSMVTDIVRGSFKGFALLRQASRPTQASGPLGPFIGSPTSNGLHGSSGVSNREDPSTPPRQQLVNQPRNSPGMNPLFPAQAASPEQRPVYAPGYGLIPASQLYDERAMNGAMGGPGVAPMAVGMVPPPFMPRGVGAVGGNGMMAPETLQHLFPVDNMAMGGGLGGMNGMHGLGIQQGLFTLDNGYGNGLAGPFMGGPADSPIFLHTGSPGGMAGPMGPMGHGDPMGLAHMGPLSPSHMGPISPNGMANNGLSLPGPGMGGSPLAGGGGGNGLDEGYGVPASASQRLMTAVGGRGGGSSGPSASRRPFAG